ncbi:MAG: GTP-binding protein [Candidatus Lokiarchaeota archaeon]|nr:GTP-binding protein [Candidatus Lokiarchaeota archaeon]
MSSRGFDKDYVHKIVVIGDASVGKTSLIKKYTAGSFNQEYIKTVGAQFSRYQKILGDNEEIRVRLLFWDIAGQDDFEFMRPKFYHGARGAIVVFDLTRDDTLENVMTWYNELRRHVGVIPTILFGNKQDLIDDQTRIDDSKIKEKIEIDKFYKFYKTSAKTGEHVHEAFDAIIHHLVNLEIERSQDNNPLKISTKKL